MLIMGSLACIQILQIKQKFIREKFTMKTVKLRIVIVFKYFSAEDLIINNTISTKKIF